MLAALSSSEEAALGGGRTTLSDVRTLEKEPAILVNCYEWPREKKNTMEMLHTLGGGTIYIILKRI